MEDVYKIKMIPSFVHKNIDFIFVDYGTLKTKTPVLWICLLPLEK